MSKNKGKIAQFPAEKIQEQVTVVDILKQAIADIETGRVDAESCLLVLKPRGGYVTQYQTGMTHCEVIGICQLAMHMTLTDWQATS